MDQSDNDLSIVKEDECKLSPIAEMDESAEVLGEEELVINVGDDLTICSKVGRDMNLETSVGNFEDEDRSSQPGTPPEVLRERLKSLQEDFEELKEFTVLEKQEYHSDCIPRDKVKSLEEEFASINEKVQHLMLENSEYQRKLEVKENQDKNLKSEIQKALLRQNECMILLDQMKDKLKEDIKDSSTLDLNELLPRFKTPEPCGGKAEALLMEIVEHFLDSLKDLNNLLEITSDEKKGLLNDMEHLQLQLNEKTVMMKQEEKFYQQNLTSVKANNRHFQEKVALLDKELAEISMTLSVLENKHLEEELANEIVNNELCKLKNEIDCTEENILSIVATLEKFVHLLNDDFDINNSFVTRQDSTELENNLKNSCNLFGISNTLAILQKIFLNLKREVRLKHEECYKQQLNIVKLNDGLRKYEEDVIEQKVEISFLEQEINQCIPSRLLELQNCLGNKDNEILRLKTNLEAANAKVDELSNKLSETTIKIGEMEALMLKNFHEKANLENEIFKLNDRFNFDNIQTQIILAVKSLENVIDSWDEKSNLEHLFNAAQGKEDICNIIKMLTDFNTQAIFNQVTIKFKKKLLLHDEETNNLRSEMRTMPRVIDYLESENEKIKLEVSGLDQVVKEEISSRINQLEKHFFQLDHIEEKYDSLFTLEGDRQKDLNSLKGTTYINCDKLKKQINNFNKASKSDESMEKNMYDLNDIENLIDSWDCSEKIQISEFTQLFNEKLLKYCDNYQNSKIKVDVLRIINKFEAKLIEFFELKSQLLKTTSFCNCVEDNNQDLFKCTIEDLQWTNNVLKEKEISENEMCEKERENDRTEEIKTIKKLMCLEITSLDETEDEGSLMCDSVENIFSKLMQVIMLKEQEMSYNLQKQQKEEINKFEQTIEKLNNKLKSQESWTNTLESENEKINTELAVLKNLNNSLDNKFKALSNDINNKNVEINIMKRKILDLLTENNSIISDLDVNKGLINKYISSINCLEKEIEKLNEDITNKTNKIKQLESKLTPVFDKQKNTDNRINIPTSDSSLLNDNRDFIVVQAHQTYDVKLSNVINEGCPVNFENQKEKISDFKTGHSEMLRKEIAFINNMLESGKINVVFNEIFSNYHDNIIILKDVIQNIVSKISEMEIGHVKDLQSIQTALECKTKEMCDFKLSISKLYWDLIPSRVQKKKGIIDETIQQCSITSVQNEVDLIKSQCIDFSNRVEEFEELAKGGQNIMQALRETIQTLVDENNNMTKLILNLQRSIESEQEKADQQKQIADRVTKEKSDLIAKNFLLEKEIQDLKSEISHLKRKIFSELDISFPDELNNVEKVAYLNQTLKMHAETQKVCYVVTEELRFFGYHCELMLSYIQTLEYNLYFTTQQKEHLEKQNGSLKGQLTTQILETNRFFNHLIAKSPFPILTQNQALEVINHIFSEFNTLKENGVKYSNENKCKQEKILQLQKEIILLTKQNSSLEFELAKCEDSIRNLRSELRTVRSKCQRRESLCFDLTEVKQEKIDAAIQTEGTCCKMFQKKIMAQKEKIDILTAKLTKNEQLQQSSVTSNPYNKQVSHLEGALGQAKEKIRRLHFTLRQQEIHNQELVEALKRHESCQQRLDEANMEIDKLKRNKWHSK